MKYIVKCKSCGEYEVKLDFAPVCCMKCGGEAEINGVAPKARKRAETAMEKMDELKPQIEAAREEYMQLMVLYEDECQLVRKYAQRGIVTPEEKEKYLIRPNSSKKSLNTLLKEYRLTKKEQE